MADVDDTDNPDNSLERALAELAEVIQPLTGNIDISNFVSYLYLIWGDFAVYPLETSEDSGSESGSGSIEIKKVISLENGRKIFDYGYCLTTSPGEDYGSYCSGKTIEAAQKMIAILAERGVTKLGFTGSSLTAKRAAWIDCLECGIEVVNYMPSEADYYVSERVVEMRKQAKQRQENLVPRA